MVELPFPGGARSVCAAAATQGRPALLPEPEFPHRPSSGSVDPSALPAHASHAGSAEGGATREIRRPAPRRSGAGPIGTRIWSAGSSTPPDAREPSCRPRRQRTRGDDTPRRGPEGQPDLVNRHRVRRPVVELRRLRRWRVPRSAVRARGCPPFDKYAVIPVARNVWQHVEGGNPAAAARRLIIARTTRRASTRASGSPSTVRTEARLTRTGRRRRREHGLGGKLGGGGGARRWGRTGPLRPRDDGPRRHLHGRPTRPAA